MAIRRIDCPHCEHHVELEASPSAHAVDCPRCGKPIELHDGPAHPSTLQGDVYDRMANDPEVRRNLRKLQWGAVTVCILILLLCVVDHFRTNGAPAAEARPVAASTAPLTEGPSTKPAPRKFASEESDPPLPDAKALLLRHPDDPLSAAPPVTKTPDSERAMRLMEAFLHAKNVDERLAYVRDVKLMEPIMRGYYARHPDGPVAFTKLEALPGTAAAPSIAFFDVHLPDGQKRRAIAGRSSTGDYRLDWASFVVYSAMEWRDFVAQRPETAVFMRVLVEPVSEYRGPFADAGRFLSVKLTDPLSRSSPVLYAYAPRRSELEQALSMILRAYPGEPMPMMLKLKHPPQSESKETTQVLIEELVGEGWVTRGT